MASTRISPLLVIVGETASGKTALAIKIAQAFNGEIICADSWTVRRKVDIGTAKPTLSQQAQVPHHLLNIVEPCEDFTAALFKNLATEAISDISSRGKLPIMVGGSGLYVDGVLYDYGFLPGGSRLQREKLNKLSLLELVGMIDKRGINRNNIDLRNKRRLIRLIESDGARPTKKSLRQNTLILGLQVERAVLKQRIMQRLDSMLEAGLEDEVRHLVEVYGWNCEALKGVSYAQWKSYFEGHENRDQTCQRIIKDTLALAKRQRTWFRRNKSIHWLVTPVKWHTVVDLVTTKLES